MPSLSEKTLELTICSQICYLSGRLMTWFGLTQQQEAYLGFDACTQVNGRLFIFQFKASSFDIAAGGRRFRAPHSQLTALQGLCAGVHGAVFYVFPLVGNMAEFTAHPDVINYTWLVDVANIPVLPPPTTLAGNPRASGVHYVDVSPPMATFWSEPVEVPIQPAKLVAASLRDREHGLKAEQTRDRYDQFRQMFGKKVYGGFVN